MNARPTASLHFTTTGGLGGIDVDNEAAPHLVALLTVIGQLAPTQGGVLVDMELKDNDAEFATFLLSPANLPVVSHSSVTGGWPDDAAMAELITDMLADARRPGGFLRFNDRGWVPSDDVSGA